MYKENQLLKSYIFCKMSEIHVPYISTLVIASCAQLFTTLNVSNIGCWDVSHLAIVGQLLIMHYMIWTVQWCYTDVKFSDFRSLFEIVIVAHTLIYNYEMFWQNDISF